jgi:hypothetical protein
MFNFQIYITVILTSSNMAFLYFSTEQ